MNLDIKKLIQLQEMDQRIHEYNTVLSAIPLEIEAKRSEIKGVLDRIEQEKNQLTVLQLKKKEKEVECAAKETEIRKHEVELNSVKSNEAYKALLTEIENAKKAKEEIEDTILNAMMEIDQLNADVKKVQSELKGIQEKLEFEIKEKEAEIKRVRDLLEQENKKRNEFAVQIPKDTLDRYEYIHNKKNTYVLAAIEGEICTGCRTGLPPSLIIEAKKGNDLVVCESCSRILYLPEPQPTS